MSNRIIWIVIAAFFITVWSNASHAYGQSTPAADIESPLIGFWKFEEGFGSEALDSSGNDNTGVLHEAAWGEGYSGGGMLFDGSDDYVDLGDNPVISNFFDAYSLAFWIKINKNKNFHGIYRRSNTLNELDAQIEVYMGSDRLVTVHNRRSDLEYTAQWPWIDFREWRHVVISWNSAEGWRVYYDGVEQTPVLTTGAFFNPTTGGSSYLGVGFGSDYLFGAIDEFKLFNQSLSPEQVWSVYQGDPLPTSTPPPDIPDASPTPTPMNIPAGYDWKYNVGNGHYYAFVANPRFWREAYAFASKIGGYLVTITEEQERDWLYAAYTDHEIWLGLRYVDDRWQWITGEDGTFTDWKQWEPSGDGEIVEITTLGWNDRPDDLKKNFIVEIGGPLQTATPTSTRMPTPTFTPTLTFTPTFTHTPTSTSTLTPTPTPSPSPTTAPTPTSPPPETWFTLNGSTLEENYLAIGAPANYEQGRAAAGEIPAGDGSDGMGLEIQLAPGQGVFLTSWKAFEISGLAHLSGSFMADNAEAAIALVGLNSPIDGQLGYTNILADEIPAGAYRRLHLIFEPPSGTMQYAIQAVNNSLTAQSTTIWIDNISIEPYDAAADGDLVPLNVAGDFENDFDQLLININNDDGAVTPFFETLNDIAIRLSIEPSNIAANLGTTCRDLDFQSPVRLLGQASVRKEAASSGGVAAMVITNGFQNLGLFRSAGGLSPVDGANEDRLILGGDFTAGNPDLPVSVFVQLGGPGVKASVVVDDLMIRQQ
ncbi:MAG: hypothetical protein JXR73_00415 [Candidatus Omnitrophica bacterium]|nr:hypothetical protein [Candidatus Omnitrophota bacterium]